MCRGYGKIGRGYLGGFKAGRKYGVGAENRGSKAREIRALGVKFEDLAGMT